MNPCRGWVTFTESSFFRNSFVFSVEIQEAVARVEEVLAKKKPFVLVGNKKDLQKGKRAQGGPLEHEKYSEKFCFLSIWSFSRTIWLVLCRSEHENTDSTRLVSGNFEACTLWLVALRAKSSTSCWHTWRKLPVLNFVIYNWNPWKEKNFQKSRAY